MRDTIDVVIPLDARAAAALVTPERREAAGRYLSGLLGTGDMAASLAEAIDDAKREARANGLTDDVVDAELEAWRTERQG